MKYYYMHEQLARTVESISNQQKEIRELKDKMKNKKNVILAQRYLDSLEQLRSNLLATKQKSIFADEEKLRERISDAYASVVSEEQRPSNLVIDRIQTLQAEVTKSESDFKTIQNQFHGKYEKAVKQEKIARSMKP